MKYLTALVAIAIVIVLYDGTGSWWHNHYDDSYITYRYAVNLAEGRGLVFNEGEKADAASSFLFTVILAGFYRVGFHDLELMSCLLNLLAVGLIAAFVYSSALRLSGNRIGAVVFGLTASLHGFISGWAALGMDTVFFAALLAMWTYWTFVDKRVTFSAVLTVLVVLMRFEGLLILPVWFAATEIDTRRALIVFALIAIYYTARFQYYGTFLPHSFHAKNLIAYYHSQPLNILETWFRLALAAPLIAFAGALTDCRLRLLGLYILVSAAVCLYGPSSDWCRYTVHLFPLMLIAGAPVLKNRFMAVIICAVLLLQGIGSVYWMRYQAENLAPCQVMRGEIGSWLQENVSKNEWIISSDIGEIAYRAKGCRFIDLNGLTSPDVLAAYRKGEGVDSIIRDKQPAYIADTFSVVNGELVYTHDLTNIMTRVMTVKQYSAISAIVVMRIERD